MRGFTLPGSPFSVRVQVRLRRIDAGSLSNAERRTSNGKQGTEREHELRSEH